MDSIVQAAGRCNRNNEQPDEPQKVFVVDVKDENLTRLPEIAESKRQTSRVINELEVIDLLSGKALDLFYKYYFFDQQNKMDYDVKHKNSAIKTTVYSLLSNNPLALQAYNDYTGKEFNSLPAAFQTASEAFSIIDGGQTGIVVPYGNALKLVCEFQKAFDPLEKMRVLRHLQKYTVNVYCYTLRSLANAGALKNIDDAFYLLSPDWYDANEQGLLSEACLQLLDV